MNQSWIAATSSGWLGALSPTRSPPVYGDPVGNGRRPLAHVCQGNAMDTNVLVHRLRSAVPSLSAVYLFGSRAQGVAGAESDVDVAIMADHPPDATGLWTLAGDLAGLVGSDVD